MLKIIHKLLLLAAFFASPAATSGIVKETLTLGDISHIAFDSKVLGQNRTLLVNLPENYAQSSQDYPVLYLLDGARHLNHAMIATQLLQTQERVPEMIIVAITNTDTWENSAGTRQHDMGYAGQDNFALYIKNEVIAYIDKNYRTTGLNTLFGHSLAGYFATNLLANQPSLFTNYIAASPVIHGDEVDFYQKILANEKRANAEQKSMYFTLSNAAEERKEVTQAVNAFADMLTQMSPQNLDWHYEYLAHQTHRSIYYPTLFNGLTHVFKSYQAPRFAKFEEYVAFGGMQGLHSHYQKRADIYGTDKNIPENTLLNLASMLYVEDKTQAALELYAQLTKDFPNSAAAYSGLGQVYGRQEKYQQSFAAHQKAVMLAKTLSPLWQQRLFKSRLDNASEKLK